MAGTGAGPSRRSHTKSRKGCKTCKRRHIRCDETFPQCRNCTKHQVRCDYMDNVGSDVESQASPDQASIHVALTPRSESRVEQWQATGSFPYPELNVFPPPQTHEYTRDELRLMHHVSTVANDLISRGTSELTLWTSQMPKFLSIAANHPFVMQALLSFSANHLAWTQSSPDMRNMYLQHGSVALGGLHEAIGSFSPTNADAVLAASLLLLWQATDYRSWSSLRAGIQSVISASQSWQLESVFQEYIAEQEVLSAAYRTHRRRSSVTTTDRESILQSAIYALQRLQLSLVGQHLELGWINQLLNYVRHLQSLGPVSSPEEQFNCLYQLRKWLFWVPTALLEQQGGQGPALLTVAHLYSVAIALEPLFPDLGCSFISALALGPLESIIAVTDAMQHHQGISGTALEIASFMEYPRATALNYRARASQVQPEHTPMIQLTSDTLNYTTIGNLSPAFAPSPLHYGSNTSAPSATQTTYLEVPLQNASSFTYGLQEWGTVPSPGLFATPFSDAEDQMYGYNNINSGINLGGFRGGLVTPTEIWT